MFRAAIILSCLFLLFIAVSWQGQQQAYEIRYPAYFGGRFSIPDNNPTTKAGVYLGRMLFYETSLSTNGKISCGSCHKQELSFTDGKAFSSGVDGTVQKRNAMALVNLLWVRNFFWDGRAQGLEDQAKTPLTNLHEMGQSLEISARKLQMKRGYPVLFEAAFGSDSITGDRIVKAISQFERTLISADSKYDKYLRGDYAPTASELNGIALFYASPNPANGVRGADCGRCHGGEKTYSELYQNNGLDSLPETGREDVTGQPYDRGRFRTVTLRNIALTAPYMHDGRFATLEEVVSHYNEHIRQSATLNSFLATASNNLHGNSLDLTKEEQKDLIAFLHMLTDSSFITNQQFSNPFLHQSL